MTALNCISRPLLFLAACAALAASASAAVAKPPPPPPSVYVAVNGSDSNPCTQAAPCATIQYGIDQAPAGATVVVGAGTYSEAHLDISKSVAVKGAGMDKTIVDAGGQATPGTYGNVLIHDTPGDVTLQGATFKNPSAENSIGSPFVVALRNPGGKVTVTSSRLSADGPVDWSMGIDYYRDSTVSAVPLDIEKDSIQGLWQGMILENPGAAIVSKNTFSGLTPTDGYGGEGIVDLAYGLVPDYWPSRPVVTDQTISQNAFTGFNGYGIVMEAGYDGGLTGEFSGSNSIDHNTFNMLGPDGVAAIGLFSKPNSLINGVKVSQNSGTIEAPGIPIWQTGTQTNVTVNHNNITVTP